MKNAFNIGSSKAPGQSGVGSSKAEIRLLPYANYEPSLNFLWTVLGQHFAVLTDASRLRLGNNMAANCADFEQVIAECKLVYAAKRKTSLKQIESEEAFLVEIERMRRFHAAAVLHA